MPFYMYYCNYCDQETEYFHKMDETVEWCETCQMKGILTTPKRVISKTSFILTGGGWGREGYQK